MQLIKSMEIKYLRSIHRLRLRSLGNLTIFSGANDVGKSNILRALNLFFNKQVDWQKSLDFNQDFSLRRRNEVRSESIKGKQFISISIQFQRPPNYQPSLPPTFRVTRTWLRDSLVPQESNDLDRQGQLGNLPSTVATARRMLSQFLNRVRFEYIPAIKDRPYFAYVLANLQDTLLATQMQPSDPILDAISELNENMRQRAKLLREDFEKATGIEADVSLPVDPIALFRAFSVSTRWGNAQGDLVPLTLRGDGIQARYIPSLLRYIADNSSHFYIWGFEEPENSVEYNLAIDLASEFEKTYSEPAQIFVTSHSPAFISLHGEQTVCYRVYQVDDGTTEVAQLHPSADEATLAQLSEDIGLFKIQEELYRQYLERRNLLIQSQEEVERLRAGLEESTKPVIYVEGKTDQEILYTAWKKLYSDRPMKFVIKSCDPLLPSSSDGAGGAGTLVKLLSTVQPDSPHIAIGVLDRDKEGTDAYDKLPNYFEPSPQIEAKISQNRKSAAFLLPVPPGREGYAKYFNLYIEFYFSETALSQQTREGWGLEFRQPQIETRVRSKGAPILTVAPSNLPETRQVINGKTVFAEKIVPTLEPSEFESFRLIFEQIQRVLTHLQETGTP